MKAFRNFQGDVREVDIDVGIDGLPILPPDTTIDPRPEAIADHYVTVVGTSWVQILKPVLFEIFDTIKQRKMDDIRKYRQWLVEQPIMFNGMKFDADDTARVRMTQALVMNSTVGYLPPVWVAYDNELYPLTTAADLVNLVAATMGAFATRFFECNVLREAATAATNQEELDAVLIPTYGQNVFGI